MKKKPRRVVSLPFEGGTPVALISKRQKRILSLKNEKSLLFSSNLANQTSSCYTFLEILKALIVLGLLELKKV